MVYQNDKTHTQKDIYNERQKATFVEKLNLSPRSMYLNMYLIKAQLRQET